MNGYVFEACHRHDELRGTFYLSQCDNLSPDVVRVVRDCERLTLVIDETPLDQVESVVRHFSSVADRVRIVTIGPAGRQRVRAYPGIIVMTEPETERDVLAVIRGPGDGLPDEVLASIARRSGHDLRLALLLVRATLRTPEFQNLPVVDMDEVWNRLILRLALLLVRATLRTPEFQNLPVVDMDEVWNRLILRLALLLVRATLRTPEFQNLPVVDMDEVWNRLMTLFESRLLTPATWRRVTVHAP